MWVHSNAVRGFTRSTTLRRTITSGTEGLPILVNEFDVRHAGTLRRKRPYPGVLGSITPHHQSRQLAVACQAPAAVATAAAGDSRHEALDRESKAMLSKLRGGRPKNIIKRLSSLSRSGEGLREEVCHAVLAAAITEAESKGGVVGALGLVREAAEVGLLRDEQAMAAVMTHCAHKKAAQLVWAMLADAVAAKETTGLPALGQKTLELVLVRVAEALEGGGVASGAELGPMSVMDMLTAVEMRGWVLGSEAMNALLGVGAWSRQWGEALAVKAQLQAAGHHISDQTAIIMMRACQSPWNPQHAQAAVAVAVAAVGSSPLVPELALELSRLDGRLREQGVGVVERRLHEGRLTQASPRLRQLLVHALAQIRSHRRTAPILEGLASIGCPTVEETWVWVLDEVASSGHSDATAMCHWMLKQMTMSGIPKTVRVYASAIAATTSGHSPMTGLEWLRQMELQDGLKPDEACFVRYISAAASRGHVREACLGMDAMQRAGHKAALPVPTYTSLLQGCQRDRKGAEEALQVLHAMREHGLQPSGHMHQLALQACKQTGAWDAAMLLLLAMERQGPKPTVNDYNIALQTCGRAGRLDEALYLLHLMERKGSKPDSRTLLAVLVALSKAARAHDAEALLRSMRRVHGLKPGLWHYVAVMDAWARANNARPALQWLAAMKKEGINPSLDSLSTVATACSRGGEWQEACRLLHHLPLLDKPDKVAGMLMNVIIACGRQGAWPVACYFFDLNCLIQSDPTVAAGGSRCYKECLNAMICSFDELTSSLFALECYDRVHSVGEISHWSARFPGMVDLHSFSRSLAQVALSHVLYEMSQAHMDPKWMQSKGHVHNPADDLVIITGIGNQTGKGMGVLLEHTREYLERSFGLRTAPYIMGTAAETTLGSNKGRFIVIKESLQDYLRTRY